MGVASLPAPYAGTPLDTERRNSRWGAWRLAGDAAECARDRERRTPTHAACPRPRPLCASTPCTPWRVLVLRTCAGSPSRGCGRRGTDQEGVEPSPARGGRVDEVETGPVADLPAGRIGDDLV